MSFSKILIAYDGSDLSNKALRKGIAIANASGHGKVDVVHVFQVPVLILGEGVLPLPNKEAEVYEKAQAVIDEAKSVVASTYHTLVTNFHLKQGEQSEGILEQATECGSDLIIIGNRGATGLREFMLGSVSHHVAQHSKVPVLIIK
ncbi:universal stress protein [Paenibacillus sp. N1-5-1-14]|uniref:universal stress protein n=1 Tax=Paenibacillus radicibacter TaxID=2972488 RepID=UPI0021594DB9|nr:universal stress protein [Paenibacillus radicibacter]MCR8645015.1 universal stress protein [Paenibacillus radicibacter]